MPARIPFVPSRNNYRLGVPIEGVRYLFDNIHWNSRDNAWYFDIREEDETTILAGFKVVLGTLLNLRSTHPFFAAYHLDVVDTDGSGRDAGFDDLGARIQVLLTTANDVLTTVG